ncbi:hypothetical protein K2X83_02765 [Patescibacteria group bacterium]|nr:hypothetical protein [Patescibacteria group bacterium]
MKRRPNDLSKKDFIETLDALYTAASSVRGRAHVKEFLKELLTVSERVMLGRRILIARMLLSGGTYDVIGRRLHVGRATIGRVEKWLQDQLPGYERAIRGLNKELEKRSRSIKAKNDPFSYTALKKKYKLHFLLFPW